MKDSKWKDALWKLLGGLRLQRLTARVALSAGLLGLAAQSSGQGVQPRVPVSPSLEPEAAVRKFRGRYVLRRVGNALTVHLAGHRSHSSHASHGSHSSHTSSSHFSSSAAPPRSEPPKPVAAPPAPEPILAESFDSFERIGNRWRVGVLATPPDTFDPNIALEQKYGVLTIMTSGLTAHPRFNGYVSVASYDLGTVSIAVQLRQAALGGVTIFAAAIDAKNWFGFRIEGDQLAIESHTEGRVAAKKIPYNATQHRFLRLRTTRVAALVMWETSSDGQNWNAEYAETAATKRNGVWIALSAGTTKRGVPGSAQFDNVVVEQAP